MTSKLRFLFAFLALLFAAASSCHQAPIYNPVDVSYSHTVKMDEAQKAIIRAGTSLRWNMKAVKPGLIVGTIYVREHTAVIEVLYNAKNFSIKYKDSTNLDYDGNALIHKNYNNWIQNLEQRIRQELDHI